MCPKLGVCASCDEKPSPVDEELGVLGVKHKIGTLYKCDSKSVELASEGDWASLNRELLESVGGKEEKSGVWLLPTDNKAAQQLIAIIFNVKVRS